MFEPPPLTVQKRGKKTFAIFIALLWVGIILVVAWGLRIQSSSSKDLKNNNLIEIIQSNEGSQLPNNIRLDELLGSKRFENMTGSDVETANPTEGAGSVEKLLEGKEIVVPENN